ncbi:hypothetical protein AB0E63_02825 [Kribbella sp. NPDC026596]|uniref:hypothetical protein n=1 Tax=Kribbella sp. NPDC026596 TaxID=3155122 RepID=UPI0033CACDC9
MSTDIERMLAAAADDSDRPLHTDVDDILVRARRSVRRGRIATVSTAVVTTAAIVGGIAAWSATRPESAGPAGTPEGQTITIDAKTGRIIDNETGNTVTPAPPVSPLSDAEVLRRCTRFDTTFEHLVMQSQKKTTDKSGPVNAGWKLVVKSGDQSVLNALFLSPDQSMVSTCTMTGPSKPESYGRTSTAEVRARSQNRQPLTVRDSLLVPVPGVTRVLVDIDGESSPREALVGTDGFVTLGHAWRIDQLITVNRIRGYDANGTKVYDQTPKPVTAPAQPTVDPSVTVKTAEPITPQVLLTKDPLTGKPLAPPPPVSPLTDEQITTRCGGVDDIYFEDAGRGGATNPSTSVIKAAGPVTKDWQVALKTGTGDKLTAVLVSPGKRVYAWCHMLTPTAKGAYDYTRGAVQADGTFGSGVDFGMVPKGVAQIVVDLPTQGPTRALISNGYYIWGLTGGNSDIQTVRVRGFDAQGKQVYDKQQQVDADFD